MTSKSEAKKQEYYWAERVNRLYKNMNKDENRLVKKIYKTYDGEGRRLEKEIGAYYQEYGENNVIEYRKLLQRLSDTDKRLLLERMDKFAEKYPQYAHLMPVRASIYKLNRLEGLQTSIKIQQLEMGGLEAEELERHLKRQSLRSANEAAELLGFGKNFHKENSDILKTTLNAKWVNKKNFSGRVWANRKKLANYLNYELGRAIARGDSYARCSKRIKELHLGASTASIKRLVRTEGTFIANETAARVFEEQGRYTMYKYSAVNDTRTSEVCKGLDGEVFKFADRDTGVNFPPMHPNCRSAFELVLDSEKFKDLPRHYDFPTRDEAIRLDSLTVEWYNSLSKEEKEAVKKYSGDSYKEINEYTRGIGSGSDELIEIISNLDSALKKFKTSRNYRFYRGMSEAEYKSLEQGNIIKNYKSLSLDKKISEDYAKKTPNGRVVIFKVPKGTAGAYVGDKSLSPEEKEFLLGRGAKYTSKLVNGVLEVTIREN